MSHYGNNQNVSQGGTGKFYQQKCPKKVHYSLEGQDKHEVRSFDVQQKYYYSKSVKVDSTPRNSSQMSKIHSEQHGKSKTEAPHGKNRYPVSNGTASESQIERQFRPSGGQMRSGHLELDTLYGGHSAPVQVNAMNAPNNSTTQCGCENIDCPFCNLMLSVEMKQ